MLLTKLYNTFAQLGRILKIGVLRIVTLQTRLQRIAVIATLVYAVIYLYMLIARPGSRQFYDAFFNIYQIIPPLFGGVVGLIFNFRTNHSNSVRRLGWLLIALACFSFASGQITWTYYESVLGIEVPFPGWADVGYIGCYAMMIPGLFLLSGSIPAARRIRQLLDSAIVACSMGAVSWCFLTKPLLEKSDVSLLGKIISVAYPLGDIAGLFGAFMLMSSLQQKSGFRRSLIFLSTGILGFAFFDSTFTWMSLNNTYRTGSWSDWTISFGWIMIAYSFLSQMWWPGKDRLDSDEYEPKDSQPKSVLVLILPYIVVTLACLIVNIYDYTIDGTIGITSVLAQALLMLLVVIRQIFALVENRLLTLELKEFNENLGKLVEKRTQELETQNREILAVIEERNRFYRHVSHEIRTPLTSVIGFGEVMMDDVDEPLTKWQRTQLGKMINGAYRLLDTMNCLLDISKIESNRMEIQCSTVKLNTLVRQIVDNMLPLADEKSQRIKLKMANNMPPITTDEPKLSQIIRNLLSNAIKYTPRDGSICIEAIGNCESVSVCVKDTGIGIPEEEMENIFREFYRVHNGPLQQGSGLGLAIVQKLSGVLGGQISVQSKQGAGSSFTLTLPIIHNACRVTDLSDGPCQRLKTA